MREPQDAARPGINRARLAHIAAWSIDLPADEAERASTGIIERTYERGSCCLLYTSDAADDLYTV